MHSTVVAPPAESGVEALREKVMLSCRMLGTRGVTRGSFGHVSARIPGTDRVLIKAKGPDEEALEFATERDIITIDLQGNVLKAPDGLAAPQETAMHVGIYRARPEVMSVIHSHPLWVVVLTACEKPLVGMYGAFDGDAALRLLEEGIPTYPGTLTITNDAMADDLVRVMGNRRACLLRGHGLTVAGGSVEETTITSLTVNDLAYANYLAYAVGGPIGVPDLADHRTRWTAGSGARPAAGVPFEWRYNRRLLETG